jgi:hypothetical protein
VLYHRLHYISSRFTSCCNNIWIIRMQRKKDEKGTHTKASPRSRGGLSQFKLLASKLILSVTFNYRHWSSLTVSLISLHSILAYKPSQHNRDILQKLGIPQLVKKVLLLYGNRRFVTVFTRDHPWSLSSSPVVFNLLSPRTPRDTFPLNFVPPKLLVHNSSYT